ncbi:hypothetical protein AGABI1DRAFT_130686 [Agaricus bisporus var. burnettii JB137-S8]|uniref:Golgi apparatus membrane protein TVP38 n=1 Tax=Agaricus bisporus var. burnettii (strain JB137-S8 / ATCC MYA-4627 / FGSC 10392) TaxID=597362 RepID=K5VS34_AGABU|nr:uncharacterized protein AGABI1DRAFT_130686 [Agaricus bisporus var. burnettii JB137-S8]EKM77274.1 hypothetical protein AGABI1DRAFT_130686 [Agaricus bisporus var. burnettii JB137-S8]
MYNPYDPPRQGFTSLQQDEAYKPPSHQPAATAYQDPLVYPPGPPNGQFSTHSFPSSLAYKPSQDVEDGVVLRGGTPSPTPSEEKEMKTGAIDWKSVTNWRFWIRKEWIWYYVALVVILVIVALMTIYHKQIVHWLTPVTRWLHDLSFGWIVPIAVLFVISFPPLFGHEIVAVLCGLVWGLWIGFGIVAAGTFLGEVGNFYAFKYCCRSRGEKLERTSIFYACLSKVVRDGGFKIALIARLSAIPGHFTTAIFSTCGMGIIVFSIAAILSLPKQFITVYLGVLLEQSADGTETSTSRVISGVVLGITTLITFVAMWYIYHLMNKVKPEVIYLRRKTRQIKLERRRSPPNSSENGHIQDPSYTTTIENTSESELPLTSQNIPMGYAAAFADPAHFQQEEPTEHYDTYLHAPKPQRPGRQIKPEEGLRSTPNLDSNYPQTSLSPIANTYDPFADSNSPVPSPLIRSSPPKSYPPTQTFSTFVGSREPASEFSPVPQYNPSDRGSPRVTVPTFNNHPSAVTVSSPNSGQQGPYSTGYLNSPEPMTESDDGYSNPLRQGPGVPR